jgi:hypothetical protein
MCHRRHCKVSTEGNWVTAIAYQALLQQDMLL